MNGCERILAALRGEQPDRTPVMLHNFMMAAREAGVSMEQFRRSGAVVADCFIRAVETYGYDGIFVDIDTATLAGALGTPVDCPDDLPAVCTRPLLPELEAVEELPPVDIAAYQTVQVWLEAVHRLRDHFGDEILIRGNCDQCAFSMASMVRGLQNWMLDLMAPERQEQIFELLAYCAQATRQFLRLMAEAGAHVLSNGDSPAGPDLISPAMHRKYALPYEQDAAACSAELGLPHILHICGDTGRILEALLETGSAGLELDHKTDARRARDVLAGRPAFFGNLDPSGILALGTVDQVREKTRELLDLFADTPGFVLNSGCALPATSPPENIRAMIAEAGR